jgi:hypothetical protein
LSSLAIDLRISELKARSQTGFCWKSVYIKWIKFSLYCGNNTEEGIVFEMLVGIKKGT